MTDDTVHLLKECDSGTKTAVNAIRQVLDNVKSTKLSALLSDSLKVHEAIGDELHARLSELGEKGKDPSGAARISVCAKHSASRFSGTLSWGVQTMASTLDIRMR